MEKVVIALIVSLIVTGMAMVYLYLLMTMAFGLTVVNWTAFLTIPAMFTGVTTFLAALSKQSK